jgi:hypothetical protein
VQPAALRTWRLSDTAAIPSGPAPPSPARKWQKLSDGNPQAE